MFNVNNKAMNLLAEISAAKAANPEAAIQFLADIEAIKTRPVPYRRD